MSKQSCFKQFSLAYVQFKCQKQFYIKQFSLAKVLGLVLFDPYMGPYQALPLQDSVVLGTMAKKKSSAFLKASVLLEPHHQIV